MNLRDLPTTREQANAFQQQAAGLVDLKARNTNPKIVAGLDVGYDSQNNRALGAVVLFSFPSMKPLDWETAECEISFPYIPGYLTFREAPAALAALDKLHVKPDLIICDGQGIAHPRRFGLACYIGLAMNVPTMGVAKNHLLGTYAALGEQAGSRSALRDKGETIGYVVRTRDCVKPLFVSPGHLISREQAVSFCLACCKGFRLPETTRWADRLSRAGSLDLPG